MKAKFEVFQGKSGQWFWHLRGRNGKIVAASEGYTRKSSAYRSLWAVHSAAKEATEPVLTPDILFQARQDIGEDS